MLRSAGVSHCIAVAVLLGGARCLAADFGPLTLSVPDGFDAPVSSERDGGVTTAWTKRRPGTVDTTLLQVSVLDGGAAFDEDAGPAITPAMYGAIAAIEAVKRR